MPKVGRPMGGVSEHCFGASPYFLNSLQNLTVFFIAYRTEEPETAAATRPFQAICISHSDGQAPPCGRYEIPFSGFRACYHGRRTLVRRPWYTRAAAAVPPPFCCKRVTLALQLMLLASAPCTPFRRKGHGFTS